MPVSDWLRWISYVTVTTALLVFTANTAMESFDRYLALDQKWRDQNQYEHTQAEKASKEIASKCGFAEVPVAFIARCLANQVQTYIEKTHSDQDLQAQKEMAYWAQALFWLTGVGAIGSFFGLWMLFRSLRHTRIAIKDTREIGEAQVRAYLALSNAPAQIAVKLLKPDQKVEVQFQVKNSGNSPGLTHNYVATILLEDDGFPVTNGNIIAPYAVGPMPVDVVRQGTSLLGQLLAPILGQER